MELLILLFLVILNGVFALSEIAVVSARRSRLQRLADQGDARAATALALAEDPNRFLSTVQIGITLVGVLAGAFGGATVARSLAGSLEEIDALAPYAEPLSFGAIVLLTTYLSLVIGELVPKRLALLNPERAAMFLAPMMQRLSWLASPVVTFLSASTTAVLYVIRARPSTDPSVTEDDVTAMIDEGTAAGIFERIEHRMLDGVLRLDDLRVDAIMTPRTEVVWLDVSDPTAETLARIQGSQHSRFPVARDSLDNVVGVVHVSDILRQTLSGQPFDLPSLARRPLFFPESRLAVRALQTFKRTGTHVAIIVGEFGGTQGILTLDDILKAIVGRVDEDTPSVVARDDGTWEVDGLLNIHEFKDLLSVDALPQDGKYQTVGGFVITIMDRIPDAGDQFEWGGLGFEVLAMDGNRVDKVLLRHR